MEVSYHEEARYPIDTEVAYWFSEKIPGSVSLEIGKVTGYDGTLVDTVDPTNSPRKIVNWYYVVSKDKKRVLLAPRYVEATVALAKQFRFLGVEELP